ncbi:hypothetical protein BC835DRAFT_1526272 [Cytidiella melzeri]|nr:hypothetical protein BC835DRAFT_1526272 [Cytidiella melzeri]
MAKSGRSKVKRQWRAKKREDSVYAVADAARLHRLSQKLKAITQTDVDGDVKLADAVIEEKEGGDSQTAVVDDSQADATTMDLDSQPPSSSSKRISTHGPRESRREEWRMSKGLPARPKSKGMNRQGVPAAKRKAGRSHRRR